jgi:hypothetical protein
MMRTISRRWLGMAVFAAMAMVLASTPQKMFGAENDAAATNKTTKNARQSWRRLPRYYSHLVSKEQTEKIYAIQDEFHPKIEAAQKTLDDITKQRNDKISAVLTPEQQKQVAEATAAATKKKGKDKETTESAETPTKEASASAAPPTQDAGQATPAN